MSNVKDRYAELEARLILLRDSREWSGVQAQDYAKSIVIEAAELLEHFQWDASSGKTIADKNKDEIAMELADIFIYSIQMAHDLGVDLVAVANQKTDINEKRFPARKKP